MQETNISTWQCSIRNYGTWPTVVRLEEKLTIFHVQIFVLCGKKNFGRLEAPT
jgi:hypothetical protein